MSRITDVRARIDEILTASGYPFRREENRCRIERGTTAVFVSAHDWKDTHTLVELLCPVLHEVPYSEPLLRRLNELNESLYFGKAYWRDDTVWIAHNLLGDELDSGELIASVGLVAVVADNLDDELKGRFGGKRWRDVAG